jgi:hypothetical protein
MNIQNLYDDLQYNITTFLNIVDTINLYNALDFQYLLNKYHSFAKRIQQWYKKYKKIRYTRYMIYYNEYQARNEHIYKTRYAQMFFSLYNIPKLMKKMKEYHFYCILDYFYRDEHNSDIFDLYEHTVTHPTYYNLKKFLRIIKVEVLLRL